MRNLLCAASASMLLLIGAMNLLAQGEAGAPIAWQTPESFSQQGRAADFIPYARDLLRQQPASNEQAARLALDLWMVATALGDQDSASLAKSHLLLEQGDSLPATFLLRVANADEQRKLLAQRFQDVDRPFTREQRHHFSRACERYLQQFGPPNDDNFWAQAALCTDNPSVVSQRQQQIKKDDSSAAKLLDIALDDRLSPREQFLKLQTLPDDKSARAYQQYLYERMLTDDDRAAVEVEAVQIERLIKVFRYAEAIPRLSKIYEATKETKFAIWLAWAQACGNEASAALATLDQALPTAGDSEWGKVGHALRETISSLEENLPAQQRAIDGVAQEFGRAPVDRLEFTLQIHSKENTPWRAYLQLDLVNEAAEVLIFRQDELLVGYQSSLGAARLYLTGEQQIQAYKTGGMIPTFAFNLAPNVPGGYRYNWNFNTAKAGSGQLRSSVRAILSSPELIVPGKRRALLEHARSSGTLPTHMQQDGENTVLRWVSLRLDAPRLDTYSITITPDRRIARIALAEFWSVTDLKYGPRQMAFSPPQWPELPVKENEEFAASNFLLLFGKLAALWEKPAAAVATKP